jgi:hypothetical protein
MRACQRPLLGRKRTFVYIGQARPELQQQSLLPLIPACSHDCPNLLKQVSCESV